MKSAEFGTFPCHVTLPFPTTVRCLVTKGELQQINVLPPYETVLCEPCKESVLKLIWPISSLKSSNMSKKCVLGKKLTELLVKQNEIHCTNHEMQAAS